MKKIFISAVIITMALVFTVQAHANLQLLGTDSLGYQLIYDTDLDITWYDYTNSTDSWDNQVAWADNLILDFGGNVLQGWRLPTSADGPYSYGYDGTTTAGYNITSSEMGHLFYEELGNTGWYDTDGNMTGCSAISPYCLTNTNLFENLQVENSQGYIIYWSGTVSPTSPNDIWHFSFGFGNQNDTPKDYSSGMYAIPVMDGMAVVPEPMTSLLFLSGGIPLAIRRFWKKKA